MSVPLRGCEYNDFMKEEEHKDPQENQDGQDLDTEEDLFYEEEDKWAWALEKYEADLHRDAEGEAW